MASINSRSKRSSNRKCEAQEAQRSQPTRKMKKSPLTPALQRIFFTNQQFNFRGREVRKVHCSPNVFEIDNFLTESELLHLTSIISEQTEAGGFNKSFTDNESFGSNKTLSEERTSTFFHLQKFGDSKIRSIETRAAELCGLEAGNVEPMQVVAYKNGQQFKLHHDAGTIENSESQSHPNEDGEESQCTDSDNEDPLKVPKRPKLEGILTFDTPPSSPSSSPTSSSSTITTAPKIPLVPLAKPPKRVHVVNPRRLITL